MWMAPLLVSYFLSFLVSLFNTIAILGDVDVDGALVGILLAILLGILVTFIIVTTVWR